MSLLSLIVVLVIIGVFLYCVNSYIPMDAKIKTILNIVVVVVVLLWLAQIFGVFEAFPDIRVGPVRK